MRRRRRRGRRRAAERSRRTAAPPSDTVTTRRAQAIHKEAGDLAKLLGHTNSRGNADSKWADAMLDALILEVTGGRTCSAAEITVFEDSKLGAA
jgi:hypothetical protein